MIGLAKQTSLGLMVRRHWVAQATEVSTYGRREARRRARRRGAGASTSPRLVRAGPLPCDIKLVR